MIKKIINFLLEININFNSYLKLNKISKQIILKPLSPEILNDHKTIWNKLYTKFSKKFIRAYYSVTNIESSFFVPENIYYNKIEPALNNKAFTLAYADKNFYEKFLLDYKNYFPETILRGINGTVYDSYYNPANENIINSTIAESALYIIKPASETSGGANVALMTKSNNRFFVNKKDHSFIDFLYILNVTYSGNFVIQKKIEQHRWFRDFNETSINTIRLFTYRSVENEKVIPLHAIIRFGKPGSIVDNQAAGGLTCGIGSNGNLNNFVSNKYGVRFEDLPFLETKANTKVPFLDEIKEVAIKIASNYNYHRLLGFDFCVDNNNNIKLLEINCKNIEINFLQINNGPLFGDYTEEIIQYCKNAKKSVVLDFTV